MSKSLRSLIIGSTAVLLTLGAFSMGAFRALEWKSWDLRLRALSKAAHAGDDIVLIMIDQPSLDVYEQEQGLSWPWPRQMYSALVDYGRGAGVKAVFIDLIFSEGSVWGVDDDADLARSIQAAGNVFLPLFLSRAPGVEDEIQETALERFAVDLPGSLTETRSATLPVESLLSSVRGLGNVRFAPDGDGIYRRLPLLFSFRGRAYPALPAALFRYAAGDDDLSEVPRDHKGNMILRYYGPAGTYETYSAAAVINSFAQIQAGQPPQISPELFKGKIVMVGASAPGIYDLRPSPFSSVYPGVEIQATALDNLLRKDFIRLPPRLIFLLLLTGFSFFMAFGITMTSRIWKIVAISLLGFLLPAAAAAAAFNWGFWLDFIAPEFAVGLSFAGAVIWNYRTEGRQRRFIKSVFRRYLSHHVIEQVLADPSRLRLGGEEREITSFFSDVAGFTSVSEGLSPETLVKLLNEYLTEMTDIILDSGGTLDKYEGDAMIVFWNAPLDQADHALRACRAALRCQKRLEELRPDFQRRYGHPLHVRIGLNSGPAVVGNMGSQNRFDYTAMGDTVNLASRLEGACKVYKVPILMGERTFQLVGENIVSRELDCIKVVGKAIPVHVYEVIGEPGEVSEAKREAVAYFHRAVRDFRARRWDEAWRRLQTLNDDPAARVYRRRIEELRKNPPPADWNGTYELKSK